MAGAPKVTFDSLLCVFAFFGASGSVGALPGHNASDAKKFFTSDAKTPLLFYQITGKMAEKPLRKSCDVGLRCEISACILRSRDAKCLRFGLSLRFARAQETSRRSEVLGALFRPTFQSVRNLCVFVLYDLLKLTKSDLKIDCNLVKTREKSTKID